MLLPAAAMHTKHNEQKAKWKTIPQKAKNKPSTINLHKLPIIVQKLLQFTHNQTYCARWFEFSVGNLCVGVHSHRRAMIICAFSITK